MCSCSNANYENTDYLHKVLGNLKQIKSANYYEYKESYLPGDTTPKFGDSIYVKEYDNPSDTTIGASFIAFQPEDTTKMKWCYDGKIRARVNREKKFFEIDSFKNNKLPFRPITPPFFNYTTSIIKYALETKDSSSIDINDLGESVRLRLKVFNDKQVEFFGKPFYLESPNGLEEEISKYEIWINKSNNLPYKVNREMSHDRSVNTITDINKINKDSVTDFNASDYFPEYPLKSEQKENPGKIDLVGKVAPEWSLKDTENNSVNLHDLKSKVIMIQFTGIGCGACHASIPFLKQLVTEYKAKDFEFVSIETWNSNLDAIKRYKDRHEFNFKFLNATNNVTTNYQVKYVPVFFILDENRVVRKIIKGYNKDNTDKEVRDILNEMI